MAASVQVSRKMGYRRTESEPANATVNDIRCKFESSSDNYTSPDIGLAFGFRKSTPPSPATSDAMSPLVPRKPVIMETKTKPVELKRPIHKPPVKQISDSKLDKLLNTVNKTAHSDNNKGTRAMKPNTLILPNGNQSKLINDKPSVMSLHNKGIVHTRKLNLDSPVLLSPSVAAPTPKVNKLKTESLVNKLSSLDRLRGTKEVVAGGKIQSSDQSKTKDTTTDYRLSLQEDKSQVQPAKTFWKSLSQDYDTNSSTKHDSVLEPGMDYTKLRKSGGPTTPGDKPKIAQKVAPKTAQLTANNLKKVSDISDTLSDSLIQRFNSFTTDDSKSSRTTLSKSPSVSSTCSSMDSFDIDYVNGAYSHKLKRRDTRPPQNIVARRTQLFEKSMDEINSVLEEAEAYNKVKEAGFGTVFKPKGATTNPVSSPKSQATISCVPLSNSQPLHKTKTAESAKKSNGVTNNNNSKFADKNLSEVKPLKPAIKTDKIRNDLADAQDKVNLRSKSRGKPLPQPPVNHKQNAGKDFLQPPPTALKTRGKGPPAKPPRTFEHPQLTPTSSNEIVFDPAAIPRQAGDGEENHDYERHISCQSPHVYTSVTLAADARTYTTTTSMDTRPYTSLTTAGGSGGDDSVAGSENAYDTLGRASVASSYEHYDTISQSELDSDISRPPTLPRRPSNLRHRPLTTAFSHMDISKNNATFQNQLNKALSSTLSHSIKETSPTSPSPTKMKVPFKLKYLLPKALRKADEIRKASSMADLLDEKESLYDSVEVRRTPHPPEVPIDEAGYALPDLKGSSKWQADSTQQRPGEPQQMVKSQQDKVTEKIRLKLNQAFSALRKPVTAAPTQASDGEDDERPPDPEMLEERLKHCTSVKEHAIYASVEQIKGFMTRVYAQLYDYAVIIGLRKSPESNVYEPYVKYKFPPQINVEQTTVPQFCYPDAHIWHKCTDYKSEAFSFVLTDVTGTRQYGYCKRVLPPDLNNLPRTAEVICVVSPLNATKLYNQVLDEVEKRRMQNLAKAEEFLQAVYGRPLPSPGQSVTIRAMNVYEEPECLVFTRSPDSQREGIDYECLLNQLSVSQIVKIFASILLERKIIFIAEKLGILSSCVHAFASLIYPFSWQHTFIPLLPPNLIDVVCAPTPFIVGLLSSNSHLLTSLDDEMEEVLIVDLDNHRFLQRMGDEKMILPKKLHRALTTALDMAKSQSESQNLRSVMIAEAFLRFFLETTGAFNHFMIHVPGAGRQFQKEEFVCNASNVPSIMVFLQWFTETQMFEVYTTERENDRNVISGTFEERVFEFQSEDHEELFNDSRRFKKFKLFGKNKKR